MSSFSAGRGQKNAPDSPPIARDPGGDPSTQARISQTGKQHKSRLEKYIQEQTRDGAMIVEVFLAVAPGRPFPMKYVLHLPLTSEQWALARGAATPEQRRIAMKQPRFIVVRMPYYPTVTDMKEAINWLADR